MTKPYDNTGQVAIWPNDNAAQNAPSHRGKVYAHRDIAKGEEIEITLWENVSDNPKAPVFKGKIGDKFVPGQQSNRQPAPKSQGFRDKPADNSGFQDDDIPFR